MDGERSRLSKSARRSQGKVRKACRVINRRAFLGRNCGVAWLPLWARFCSFLFPSSDSSRPPSSSIFLPLSFFHLFLSSFSSFFLSSLSISFHCSFSLFHLFSHLFLSLSLRLPPSVGFPTLHSYSSPVISTRTTADLDFPLPRLSLSLLRSLALLYLFSPHQLFSLPFLIFGLFLFFFILKALKACLWSYDISSIFDSYHFP